MIIGFFITDEAGSITTRFEGDNSFHVLWRTNQRSPFTNDGPVNQFVLPATTGNAAYDILSPSLAMGIYGEWEPTRALPGEMAMTPGHYACDFVLTEESFHDSGNYAGNWTAAMGAPIEFDIGAPTPIVWNIPADITYPAPLSSTQLNATAPAAGTFIYSPPLGTVLSAGSHNLSVQFTPDATGVAERAVTVPLNVLKGVPNVEWNPPQNVRANRPLDKIVLNATANTAGQFHYDPPLGTKLSEGPHTLTLQFLADDQQNFNLAPLLSFDVEAVAGLLIVSGPEATPNPAYAGSPVQFSAVSETPGLVWSWDFGDGSPIAAKSMAAHSYLAAGTYSAKVTAHVRNSQSETQTITVTVLPVPPEVSRRGGCRRYGRRWILECAGIGLGQRSKRSCVDAARRGKRGHRAALRCAHHVDSHACWVEPQIAHSFQCGDHVPMSFTAADRRMALGIDGQAWAVDLDGMAARASVEFRRSSACGPRIKMDARRRSIL